MEEYAKLAFHPKVKADIDSFDGSVRQLIYKALHRIQESPDIGKPLGNSEGRTLTGLLSVKLRKHGIRIVYERLSSSEVVALVVAVGSRERHKVYEEAARRKSS